MTLIKKRKVKKKKKSKIGIGPTMAFDFFDFFEIKRHLTTFFKKIKNYLPISLLVPIIFNLSVELIPILNTCFFFSLFLYVVACCSYFQDFRPWNKILSFLNLGSIYNQTVSQFFFLFFCDLVFLPWFLDIVFIAF